MSRQERNEECQGNYHEKQETGYPGYMPGLWNQDVQDRQGLEFLLQFNKFKTY